MSVFKHPGLCTESEISGPLAFPFNGQRFEVQRPLGGPGWCFQGGWRGRYGRRLVRRVFSTKTPGNFSRGIQGAASGAITPSLKGRLGTIYFLILGGDGRALGQRVWRRRSGAGSCLRRRQVLSRRKTRSTADPCSL